MTLQADEITRKTLRHYLKERNFSIRAFAKVCGVSYSHVSRFLRGSPIGPNNLQKISYVLEGKKPPEIKPVVHTSVICGDQVFLITIERV